MVESAEARRAGAIARVAALAALVDDHASPHGARVRLGPPRAWYPAACDELQGFARPLFAFAALAQGGDAACLPERTWDRLRRGLAAGSDPGHPEWWGPVEDDGQTCCEIPAIALALVWARAELWDPLPGAVRERLLGWLGGICAVRVHPNNWLWFRILTRLALARLGAGLDRVAVTAEIDQVSAFASGPWSLDGRRPDQRTADWYVPMALGIYPLLAAELVDEAGLVQRLRGQAARLACIARRCTAVDGAPLAWGRSLSYRRASAGLWSAYAWADLEALPWSEIAWHWRQQQAWWDRQSGLGGDGSSGIGYTYPNPRVGESYIAHTSPLWWCKSLLALRRPATHPFWSSEARPPPALPPLAVPEAGMLFCGGADPLLLSVGQFGPAWMLGATARYGRWAYDAHAGFLLPAADEGPFPDGTLLVDAGDGWCGRPQPASIRAGSDGLAESWTPCAGVRIDTRLALHHAGHRRYHRIHCDRPIRVREGGFPIPPDRIRTGRGCAELLGGGLRSRIVTDDGRQGGVWAAPDGSGLIHRHASVPVLDGQLAAGVHDLRCQVRIEGEGTATR